MNISKLLPLLLLLMGLITCHKNIAQTYSTDFDGVGNGNTITIGGTNSGSSSGIVPPSTSTIVNHQNISTNQQSTSTQSTQTTTTPSISTMVGGMIMQSVLNNLLAPTPVDTKQQEAEAQARLLEQQRIAAENAEKQRIIDSINLAKYNKLMYQYQDLPGSSSLDLVPLSLPTNTSNNFFGSGNQGVSLNDDAFSELNAIESIQLKPDEIPQSELFTVLEPSTIDYYKPEEPPANSSPKESMVKDVVFYAQSVEDAALSSYKDDLIKLIKSSKLGTVSEKINIEKFAKYSSFAGAGIGIYSYYDDLATIYKDKNFGLNSKSLYEVSTAVADAGLMVAGIAATSTVVFGTAVVVGTPLALTAGTVMLLGKYYITQNPEIYNKPKW